VACASMSNLAMGQSGEALECYVQAAQRALARGDQAECERLADRALQLNAKSLDALIVKARSFSSVGNTTKAAEILESVPDSTRVANRRNCCWTFI